MNKAQMRLLSIPILALLITGCDVAQPTKRVENGKEVRVVLDRAVNNCDDLAREIEVMTQTTAELRKVLRDMEHLTCALPNSLPKGR